MPIVRFSFLILIGMAVLWAVPAFATKCLKAQTLAELKDAFPVVVRGVVTERKKTQKSDQSLTLKIRIEKYLKGDLGLKELKATQVHVGRGLPRTYEVGKEYTFVAELKDKAGAYEVALPADGCPDLPKD
jgi:hypothetical protein